MDHSPIRRGAIARQRLFYRESILFCEQEFRTILLPSDKVLDDAIPFFLFLELRALNRGIQFCLLGFCEIQCLKGSIVNILRLIQLANRIQSLPKHCFPDMKGGTNFLTILGRSEECLVVFPHKCQLVDTIQLTQTALDFIGISANRLLQLPQLTFFLSNGAA